MLSTKSWATPSLWAGVRLSIQRIRGSSSSPGPGDQGSGGVAAFIRSRAEPGLAAKLAGLRDDGLSYLAYDWSLNDTARSR